MYEHISSNRSLRHVNDGVKRLAQVVLGASHLVQKAVPAVLTPKSLTEHKAVAEFKSEVQSTFASQASLTFEGLRTCPGLVVTAPQGAMYLMAQIDCSLFDDAIHDDLALNFSWKKRMSLCYQEGHSERPPISSGSALELLLLFWRTPLIGFVHFASAIMLGLKRRISTCTCCMRCCRAICL